MTSVGIQFPNADENVKYIAKRANEAIDIVRDIFCDSVVIEDVVKSFDREFDSKELSIVRCNDAYWLQKAFDEHPENFGKLTQLDEFPRIKTFLLQTEEDVIASMCHDGVLNKQEYLDSIKKHTRSLLTSLCSDKPQEKRSVAAALTVKDAVRVLEQNKKNFPSAVKDALEKSTLSCPSGLELITANWLYLLVAFFCGIGLALLIKRG